MAIILDMGAADFEPRFRALLEAKRESALDVDAAVAAIIADVRARGDAALVEYRCGSIGSISSRSGFRIGAGNRRGRRGLRSRGVESAGIRP